MVNKELFNALTSHNPIRRISGQEYLEHTSGRELMMKLIYIIDALPDNVDLLNAYEMKLHAYLNKQFHNELVALMIANRKCTVEEAKSQQIVVTKAMKILEDSTVIKSDKNPCVEVKSGVLKETAVRIANNSTYGVFEKAKDKIKHGILIPTNKKLLL